jgi:hypothetical protein
MSTEIPTDIPCYEVNPELWARFATSFRSRFGFGPLQRPQYTEEFCSQWLDFEIIEENHAKSGKKTVDSL